MVKEMCICSECTGVITEPMCVACFAKEVFIWLHEQELTEEVKAGLESEILEIIKTAQLLSLSDMRCVLCKKRMHNVCNYCLLKEIRNTIKEHEKEESETMFNYSIYEFGLHRA